MEERKLDARESMELISRMIQNTRNRLENHAGRPFLVWGYTTVGIALLNYWFNIAGCHPAWCFTWFLIPIIGCLLMRLFPDKKPTEPRTEIDRIVGLELGADDYIVKPFSPREVVARIKAVLRRTSEQPKSDSGVISYNGLTIDLKSYTVTLRGEPVVCTPKEIEILYMLASNPGQVFTREQLLSRVWGYDFAGETRTVDTHIKRIRAKLCKEGNGWDIKTVWGVGYKFEMLGSRPAEKAEG